MNDNMFNEPGYGMVDSGEPLSVYTAKTFGWMALGLLVTFLTAVVGVYTGTIIYFFYLPAAPFLLLAIELVVVVVLSARLHKLSVGAARGMFFLYAILNGITFSVLLLAYDWGTMLLVFGITAVYFGALAAYGYLTKRDLTSLRPLLFGALIFLALFWVLSMFLPLSGMERVVCLIGVVVFMAYTAYDTQKIKHFYEALQGDQEMLKKASIISALELYLDFINLFLYILRLVGRNSKN